ADAVHKGAVDLKRVDGEAQQVTQRRVASAEIVKADFHAERAQLAQHLARSFGVLNDDSLSDLQLQVLRLKTRLIQYAAHVSGKVRLRELIAREIDANNKVASF